jgi:DNA-binding transcriptional regulator YiaG
MNNKYQNEFLGSLYETAEGLHKIGLISDVEMREYDESCLVHEPETAPKPGNSRNQPIAPVLANSRK